MKNLRPVHLLIGGSVIITLLTFVVALILEFKFMDFDPLVLIGLPLLSGVFSLSIFYFFIKFFINDRLKMLYRSIRKEQIVDDNELKFSITDDVIASAEMATQQWTEERNKEISKLKEQEAFRREFLGNLAHELKTPVFSIQGYILTLLDGGLEDENVNRAFLERASKATDRMVNILEDLDQITRLEVDDLKLNIRSFDIHELVEEVFDSLELIAKEKNIQLQFFKDYGTIYVSADRSKISQVLTNLLVNSLFYGKSEGHSTVRIDTMGDIVTIEIADDGPGIDAINLPRLFERFYRVEKSRNRNEGGTGLGLAIVKHIIESHGQTISVRSTVGLGSTFVFSLDRSKQQSPTLYSSRGLPIK